MLNIRSIKEDELDLLLDLIKEMASFEKLSHEVIGTKESLYKTIFIEKEALCELLFEDNNIVGYLLYFYNFSSFTGSKNLYIEDIFIKEEYRKKGYGKACFKFLCDKAYNEDIMRIDWICLDWNQNGLDFYKKMGAKNLDFWRLHRLDRNAIEKIHKEDF